MNNLLNGGLHFSFGSVPESLNSIALILALVSLAVEAGAGVYLCVALFLRKTGDRSQEARILFDAGKGFRNAGFLVLVLLFLIADRKTYVDVRSVLRPMAQTCWVYMMGSLVVALLTVVVAILGVAVHKNLPGVRNARMKMWWSGLFSLLVAGALAYFLG